MKIVDLSHPLENGMPVFPGDPPPAFAVQGDLAAGDAASLTHVTMTTHTGTHIDGPAHVFSEGWRTDGGDLSPFIGRGAVVDCRMFQEGERIPVGIFQQQDLSKAEFILLYCGWDKHWGTEQFFGNYPVLSAQAAKYLARMEHLKGVGVEYGSIDPLDDHSLTLHRILLGKGKGVVENLCNLDALLGREFLFCALPLKFKTGEASPVRAVAMLDWD